MGQWVPAEQRQALCSWEPPLNISGAPSGCQDKGPTKAAPKYPRFKHYNKTKQVKWPQITKGCGLRVAFTYTESPGTEFLYQGAAHMWVPAGRWKRGEGQGVMAACLYDGGGGRPIRYP